MTTCAVAKNRLVNQLSSKIDRCEVRASVTGFHVNDYHQHHLGVSAAVVCRAEHRRDLSDFSTDHSCTSAEVVLLDDDDQPVQRVVQHPLPTGDDGVTYVAISGDSGVSDS